MIFDKCYITYNITCTIISHIFQNLSLRILFLASLKINDWLIKKKRSYSWKQLRKCIHVCPFTKKPEEIFNDFPGIVIDSLLLYMYINYS